MHEASEVAKVAVYWDFENLHAVLADKARGEGFYRENRYAPQTVIVKLAAIVDYAASFGDVIINRAYGNWQWFSRYQDVLNEHGIDLVQLFPRGAHMKNSADIRMALDALGDLHTLPHLTHVVIVSSDSDFISLAQRVKQAGKFVAGVGVNGVSNKYWVSSCNEFKYYEALQSLAQSTAPSAVPEGSFTGLTAAEVAPVLTMDQARSTLVKAMTQLVARKGENYVANGGLKNLIKRLMPAFDEGVLGCANFTDFINRFPDLLKVMDATSGGHVAFRHYTPPQVTEIVAPKENDLPGADALSSSKPKA